MRIGIDIDNVISTFNENLLEEYIKHDIEIGGPGIVNKDVFVRNMFNWNEEYEKQFYYNNIEKIAMSLQVKKDAKKYMDKLIKD